MPVAPGPWPFLSSEHLNPFAHRQHLVIGVSRRAPNLALVIRSLCLDNLQTLKAFDACLPNCSDVAPVPSFPVIFSENSWGPIYQVDT